MLPPSFLHNDCSAIAPSTSSPGSPVRPPFHGKAIAPILCAALRKLRSNFFAFFSRLFFRSFLRAAQRGGRRKGEKTGHAIGERYSSRTDLNGPIASLLLWTRSAQMWDLRAFSEWERQSMLFVYCCRSPYYTCFCTRVLFPSLVSPLQNNRREYPHAVREIRILSAYEWITCADRRSRFCDQNLHLQIDSAMR